RHPALRGAGSRALRPRRPSRAGPRLRLAALSEPSRSGGAHEGRELRRAGSLRHAPRGGARMKRPILGVTMGDRAGGGPSIIARAFGEPAVIASSRPVVIGSAAIMKEALGLVGSPLALHVVRGIADGRWEARTLECLDLGNVEAATLPRGEVSAA